MATNSVESAINKVKAKGTILRVLGWILAVFNGFIALVGSAASGIKEALDVVLILFFLAIVTIGVWLIIKGNKMIKLIKTYYDYSTRLAADPEKSIDLLASVMGITVATATKNINDMIAAGFFPNCYLDGQHNKLVIPTTVQPQASTVSTPVSNATTQTVKYSTVQCKGCGATNKIISGTVGECEFCGSQISE
ncbi:MAG: PCI domain-containing protein [Eubacterium sp.]|nr:PCI domain-containing protein [Eubacterium sp.]